MPASAGNGESQEVTAAEQEMEIRLQTLRVREALNARDVALARLASACASVHEKAETVRALQQEKEALQRQLNGRTTEFDKENPEETLYGEKLGVTSDEIRLEEYVQVLENKLASLKMSDATDPISRARVETEYKNIKQNLESSINQAARVLNENISGLGVLRDVSNAHIPVPLCSPFSNSVMSGGDADAPESPWTPLDGERAIALPTVNTAQKIEARYGVLASLPLPSDIPDDSLTPILIPAPFTLHDFIGTTSGLLRSQLGNYRVFQQSTTTWCPEREEHGYYLTPVFKCSTNPRVNTAHRWSVVDMSAKLDKPTECFYNKDGKWYYAGVYRPFRLDDLCPQEWECLSAETSQALIRETLAGRKNTSPQNFYETGQLYSVGALRVACIGLQCIGFNSTLYRGLLEHAALCTQMGKWRAPPSGLSTGLGIGSAAAAAWNATPNATVPITIGIPTTSAPGSPITMGTSPQAGILTFGGRLPSGPVQPPTAPSIKILQHGVQDISVTSAGRLAGKP